MITIHGKTHVGGRKHNEDRFVAEPGWGIALVADGMGGPEAGEVAAGIVAAGMVDRLDAGENLADAVAHTHDDVQRAPRNGKGFAGMGATLVVARFQGHDFELAWIGDSRGYLWNGALRQVTRDHSKLELLLGCGALAVADARDYREKNVITRAMGLGELTPEQVPLLRGTLCRGQQLLLCSDGISDVVSAVALAAIMATNAEPMAKLAGMIEAARAARGGDNMTAVLVGADCGAPAPETAAALPPVAIAWADGNFEYYSASEQARFSQGR